MTNKALVLFRADGNEKMGLGHLFRSSALAEMINDEYTCILATTCDIPEVYRQLNNSFDKIIQLAETSTIPELNDLNSDQRIIVVLDGYHFRTAYQKSLIEKGFEVICIDDIHEYPFEASVIINHAGGLKPTDYIAKPSTQFFLGPSYALLKKPFLDAAKNRRKGIEDNNYMICFGGADPNNKSAEVLDYLLNSQIHFGSIHVVIGSAYKYERELRNQASGNNKIIVHKSLSSTEMVKVMQKCSWAICSPSTIVYEYLSVGGVVILEQIADNQKDVIKFFLDEGLAFRLQDLGKKSPEDFENSIVRSAKYFDGNSGKRLKKLFDQFCEARKLEIRRVKAEDVKLTYEWANDPDVRSQSYNQESISYENHSNWFLNKLNDPFCYYYILELEGKPVAQIRFHLNSKDAILGYLAAKEIRSKGLGTSILGKGIETLINDCSEVKHIIGYVKKTNLASQKSFEKLLFNKEETSDYPDSFKYTMNYGD